MAIQVQYDMVVLEGGSPFYQSFRSFRRAAATSIAIKGRITAEADTRDWQTPCLQNRVDGYVTITGESDFYGVIVNVSGAVVERGRTRGPGGATGGLSWSYIDDKGAVLERGHLNATALPPPRTVKTSGAAAAYPMIIPARQRTKVCSLVIAGGLRIGPRPPAFDINVEVSASLNYVLQFTDAYLTVNEAFRTVIVPFEVRPDVKVSRGSTELIDQEAFFSRASIRRIDEQFQDPALRRAIGEAGAFETRLASFATQLLNEGDRNPSGGGGKGRKAAGGRRGGRRK